jgi:hypothetical protein
LSISIAAALYYVCSVLEANSYVALGLAILCAVLIYVFAVLMLGVVTSADFDMMPKGEKIKKLLTKLHLLKE